ncbi:MAG TPA: thiamine phosphate synthase [Actinomycetota bacterium]|nr:thiamine phosphate synthase [Actinomycetota bacterium]
MTALADARLYLVAESTMRAGKVADLVPELAGAGVDVLQLREKETEAGPLFHAAQGLAIACRTVGIPLFVNDRPDIAVAAGAAGVHLGQDDLPVAAARRAAPGLLTGWSTHSEEQIDAVLSWDERPDYIAVGPLFETPTKPGRPATGLGLVRYAAATVPGDLPWFAIGGIDHANLGEVLDAGARRIVVVRAIAEAEDPAEAAAGLRAGLDSAASSAR